MNRRRTTRCSAAMLAVLLACSTAMAQAPSPAKIPDKAAPQPVELEGVGIDEKLNQQVPLDLAFLDENGRPVKLGDYFKPDRPVLLTLVYFSCPKLCGLVSNAQLEVMKELDFQPGKEYTAVTVSFDPNETTTLAKLKKQNYLKALQRPGAAEGWVFLTGKQTEITRLTRSVGFNYRWDEVGKQFVHAAVFMVLTPDGKVSRYFYGIDHDEQTLRLSLVEAANGRIGSSFDRVLLYCFHYDPDRRGYSLAARNLMSAAGGLTIVAMLAWLVPWWVRRRPGRTGGDTPAAGSSDAAVKA